MDVRKIAALAHLEITDEEVELYTPQLNNIVEYVQQLNELDTDAVEASIGGLTEESETTIATRGDSRIESLGQEKALEQAPEASEGHFRVPKVL
ncbi:MAG: Asp-tRNA(Asn)/Glu-tRNA(Gln) amidotransferase subunit GatC [Pyrinomonadaceae bacterium]